MEGTRVWGDMGMEGTRVWKGHVYGKGQWYGRANGIEGICVWKRQGYGGDIGMEGHGYRGT